MYWNDRLSCNYINLNNRIVYLSVDGTDYIINDLYHSTISGTPTNVMGPVCDTKSQYQLPKRKFAGQAVHTLVRVISGQKFISAILKIALVQTRNVWHMPATVARSVFQNPTCVAK